MAETASSFDFVIVGGGPAACVAAARLAGAHGFSVALIERGPASASAGYRMPLGHVQPLANGHGLEVGQAAPLARFGDRHPRLPLPNVLGGGSAVGGMVWQTGQREDYDAWAYYVGRTAGWAYEDLLPHLLELEDQQLVFGAGFGSDGPVSVGPPPRLDPLSRAFLRAAQAKGYDLLPVLAQGGRVGAGPLQFTLAQGRKGTERADAASLFLRDRHGGRLTVMTGTPVRRILFEGQRALGVEVAGKGEPREIRAKREVLVAAGAIHSPQLLQLSGIGPGAMLQDLGIEVRSDLPGVGSNLQDHVELPLYFGAGNGHGYHGVRSGLKGLRNRLNYRWFGGGPLASPGFEAGLYCVPGSDSRPGVLVTMLPAILADAGLSVKSRAGVTLAATLLRPKARGSVRLKSADPADPPLIDTKLLDHEDDRRRLTDAFRVMRELVASAPLAGVLEEELHPGASTSSETEIHNWLGRAARPAGHFAGTARMGPGHDPLAVLDSRLVVRGVEGLRVIDTSIMPFITSGGTLAPAMMIGRHAAEIVAQDHKTATEPATVAQAPVAAVTVPTDQPEEAATKSAGASAGEANEAGEAKPRRLSLARFAAALSASGKREPEPAGPAQLVDDLAEASAEDATQGGGSDGEIAREAATEPPADIENLMAEIVTSETVEREKPSSAETEAEPDGHSAQVQPDSEHVRNAQEQNGPVPGETASPAPPAAAIESETGQETVTPEAPSGPDIPDTVPAQDDTAASDERFPDQPAPMDADPGSEMANSGEAPALVPEDSAAKTSEPATPLGSPPRPAAPFSNGPKPPQAPPAVAGYTGKASRPPPYQPMTESGRAEAEAARQGLSAAPPAAPTDRPAVLVAPTPPVSPTPAPPPLAPTSPTHRGPPRPDWPALKSVREAINPPAGSRDESKRGAAPQGETSTRQGRPVETRNQTPSTDPPAKPEKKPTLEVPDELTDLP